MAEIKMVKLSCGCKIRFYPQSTSVTQCALHDAAPDLLEACRFACEYYEMLERATGVEHGVLKTLRAAIARATKVEP